ncbi:ABC1 kinase family protein [Bradyrhizobium guangdongense]|uniref:ABC1 kinase family protein n=1 Tax=Bradyrhizobium guangdongense TaxID=1325090 RepID=UPI0016427AC3|nr:AarF/UbiB family protein [Bradyrhizobium guangdongense]
MRLTAHVIARTGRVAGKAIALLPVLVRSRSRRVRAQALRSTLESLGTNWIKLGQTLALRFDLWPAEYCSELLAIRNDPTPLAYSAIRGIVVAELGVAPEQAFVSFAPEPFTITSSGQFHLATAPDGTKLVVKVQDPSMRRECVLDARLMRLLAGVGLFRGFEIAHARDAVEEFVKGRFIELNLETTLTNAERMAALADDDEWESSARFRREWSAGCVLTSELVDGIPISQIIDAKRRSGQPYLREIARRGYDIDRIARHLYWNALNEIFRDGIFHADISPAGILALAENGVSYVDYAVIGRLSEDRQESLRYFWRCAIQQKFDAAVDELLYCLEVPASYDATQFRRDVARVLEDYVDGFSSPVESEPRRTAQRLMASLMTVVRKHQLALPTDLAQYFTTMLTLESIVFELSPSFNAAQELMVFFRRAAVLDIEDAMRPAQAFSSMVSIYQQARLAFDELQTVQRVSHGIDISLRTLRLRLLQQGFWAVLVAAAAYLGLHSDRLYNFQTSLGVDPYWTSASLLVFAIFLVSRIWRQGRQLAAIDRSIVSTTEVSGRSGGHVR